MSNFSQYVDTAYVIGGDLNLKLSTSWDKAVAKDGCELVIVPQTIRRVVGIAHTPKRLVIGANDERLQAVLAINSKTSEAHVAKFAAQAAQAKQDKANRVIITGLRANLKALGIDL